MSVRSGAAEGTAGYFHEMALYDSDDAFLAIVEPFLREGVEAGEPTLVTCAEPNSALLRRTLADLAGVTFVPGESRYVSPAATIRSYRNQFPASWRRVRRKSVLLGMCRIPAWVCRGTVGRTTKRQ